MQTGLWKDTDSLSVERPRAVIGVIGDAFSGDGLVQYVERPLLVARVVIEVGCRRRWRIGRVLVEMDLAVNAGRQVRELGREPHQP